MEFFRDVAFFYFFDLFLEVAAFLVECQFLLFVLHIVVLLPLEIGLLKLIDFLLVQILDLSKLTIPITSLA